MDSYSQVAIDPYNQFASVRERFAFFSEFEPKKYFSGYDYFEPYDPHKKYNTKTFTRDYGKGIRQYVNRLYEMQDWSSSDVDYYVVAKQILTDMEKADLSKYCSCDHCAGHFFWKCVAPRSAYGCVKSGSPDQHAINQARENMLDPTYGFMNNSGDYYELL